MSVVRFMMDGAVNVAPTTTTSETAPSTIPRIWQAAGGLLVLTALASLLAVYLVVRRHPVRFFVQAPENTTCYIGCPLLRDSADFPMAASWLLRPETLPAEPTFARLDRRTSTHSLCLG